MLFLLCAVYAYLEFRAFGHDESLPMYGYLLAGGLALVNAGLSWFGSGLAMHNLRLLGNGLVAMVVVILAVYLQKYSAWHALEFVLLLVWLGSLAIAIGSGRNWIQRQPVQTWLARLSGGILIGLGLRLAVESR